MIYDCLGFSVPLLSGLYMMHATRVTMVIVICSVFVMFQ